MSRNPAPKMKITRHSNKFLLSIALVCSVFGVASLQGCNQIKQMMGSSQPQPNQTRPANPAATSNPGQASATSNPSQQNLGPLSGYWQMGYMVNDKTFTSHIRITEQNKHFQGDGTDDHSNKTFKIEQGVVRDGKVIFYKRYDNPKNKNQTPVEFDGSLDMENGPYMSGTFVVALNGQEMTGQWEAQLEKSLDGKDLGGGEQAPAQQQQQQAPPPQQQQASHSVKKPDHAPDLSGKWNTGFEYRFKDVHSTMWLEQHGTKLKGHGVDHNTKEKFTIEKGWYSYPKVTIIRSYPKIKGKKGVIPAHTMTFKALVEWIDTSDYQGPYMKGKTDGGGSWEAELVR